MHTISDGERTVWTHEFKTTSTTGPDAVWAVLRNIVEWSAWNEGVETIEVDGPIGIGTVFR